MSNLIQQLDRDSLLLLYIADELPAPDRQEVDQLLQSDSVLRSELDHLLADHSRIRDGLAALDENNSLAIDSSSLHRQVSRLIHQWTTARAVDVPSAPASPASLRFAWWVYPTSAAAAVLLAFMVWHGRNSTSNYTSNSEFAFRDYRYAQQIEQVELYDELADSLTRHNHEELRQAEGELDALARVRDEADSTLTDQMQ